MINIDNIVRHYVHAREKHPSFCDWIQPEKETPEAIKAKIGTTLVAIRGMIAEAKRKHTLGWDDLLNCEVWEVFEALANGNNTQAIEELYDCIAILLRVIDVLEGRQPLGQPISSNSAGETKKDNK